MQQIGLVMIGRDTAAANHTIADFHARMRCGRGVEVLLARIVRMQVEIRVVVGEHDADVNDRAQDERDHGRFQQAAVSTHQC